MGTEFQYGMVKKFWRWMVLWVAEECEGARKKKKECEGA